MTNYMDRMADCPYCGGECWAGGMHSCDALPAPPQTGVLEALQAANPLRNAQWDPKGELNLCFFSNELAGEGGEAADEVINFLLASLRLSAAIGKAANTVKKLDREALGLRGSRATYQDLAAELGDVVICASLVATSAGIDLPSATREKFNATSRKIGLTVLI